jgi:GNAT superfamily N-acetyltransferase
VLDRLRVGLAEEPVDPAQVWAFLATRVNELVVALEAGEVIGLACGTVVMHPTGPTEFMVTRVVVHPDSRRQGVGKGLLLRLMALAEDRGCVHVWARASADNVAFRALAMSLKAQATPGGDVFHW